jgi:hypothetical protein
MHWFALVQRLGLLAWSGIAGKKIPAVAKSYTPDGIVPISRNSFSLHTGVPYLLLPGLASRAAHAFWPPARQKFHRKDKK